MTILLNKTFLFFNDKNNSYSIIEIEIRTNINDNVNC